MVARRGFALIQKIARLSEPKKDINNEAKTERFFNT